MDDVTQPFGGNPSLSPRYGDPLVPPPDPTPALIEFTSRAAYARHEFFKRAATSYDRDQFERCASFIVHPEHLRRLNYEFKTKFPQVGVPYDTPPPRKEAAPATVFGIPIKEDSSVPVGKILLRVEVEA